jgi:hypothetical protein
MKRERGRKVFTIGAVALILAGLCAWAVHSARQSAIWVQRVKHLKMIWVELQIYADKHGSCPPAHTTNSAGKPMQSWRVLLLSNWDPELYAQIDLNEPWDSPANRRLLKQMPEVYHSPLEAETHRTTTNYFAVVGPHAPWRDAEHIGPENTAANPEAIMLIEVVGSTTPWMEPRDPTLDELLDMLRPKSGNSVGDSRASNIMYMTVGGDLRTVAPKTDRETLRNMFLGQEK